MLNPKQQLELITDMIMQSESRVNDFPLIDADGNFKVPVLSKQGIVLCYESKPIPEKDFRGLVLQVNYHRNVTVWRYYKNGKVKEVANRV